MSRLPAHAPGSLDAEQQRVYDAIAGGKRATSSLGLVKSDGSLAGPFNAWVHAPHIGGRIQAVGEAMRFELTLPKRLAELAILCVAKEFSAQFEWFAHARLAAQAGLEADIIEAIRNGDEPQPREEADLVVYALAVELLGPGHRIPEVLFQRAVTLLGLDQVVELVNLIGYYCLVSCVLNAFAVPLPDGVTAPFAEPEPAVVPKRAGGAPA
ncbi:MAG: carboxymuconolactone decarboxylase family protein [Acidimicrobiales bacterium]|nr:carboxymuconolactone decarboxylase family protein [Acidimicrobiales bacterium]